MISQSGDIWLLGHHRLAVGDAADPDLMDRLMQGSSAKMVFTSPPYLCQRHYKRKITDWTQLMRDVFQNLRLAETCQLLINLGPVHKGGELELYWMDWLAWMRSQGFRLYDWYVWDKGFGLPGNFQGHLRPAHEWILHLCQKPVECRKTLACKWNGVVKEPSILRNPAGERIKKPGIKVIAQMKVADSVIRIHRHCGPLGHSHPAVFPVELPKFVLPIWTDKNDPVLDPFAGSGTSIIAAQYTGRRCHACEIAPEYADIALARFRTHFPDLPVILESTGETLETVMERSQP